MSHTGSLDIDEVHIMSGGVNHGPESETVCCLAMEPNVFIGREEEGDFRTDDSDAVTQHGKKQTGGEEGQDETSTARYPDRPLQGIESS